MMRLLTLLCVCWAVGGLGAQRGGKSTDLPPTQRSDQATKDAPEAQQSARGGETQLPGREGGVPEPTAQPLQDELDNQENIISQLLGDYDKVKTLSSGSDCVCRCIVRPIKRSDCSRIHDGDPASPSQAFYTVETVTKGTDCKQCVCMAPPSAVNPCEGEYRFKKLQEASEQDIKLATIMDLLEGSLYGLDLLKLNSVTTKLLTRVDNMEKAFAGNFTERMREAERMKERAKEKDKEKKAQQKKKKMSYLEHSGAKSGAAAHANKQKNSESQLKKNQQQDVLERQAAARNETEKSSVVIRGVTFYKAEGRLAEDEEDEEHEGGRAKQEDFQTAERFVPMLPDTPKTPNMPPPRQPKATSQAKPAASAAPLTDRSTAAKPAATSGRPVQPAAPQTAAPPDANITPPHAAPTAPQQRTRSRLSWTESPADQLKATKRPAVCKDTVASISEPAQQNSYGLSDGAWMRDARGHGNVIYLTNGHYGNNLLEFRDMDTFKSGQASNSYKLPYSFTGTGHVVYSGAFYYNRAFSRDVIRYDLRHRLVSAWTTLHDALLEEQVHRTQSEVELAVDESGLWLLYPALDTEGFHQEVILLVLLHPRELQPISTFRTGLRRGRYGNTFLVCGVLYAVDSMERRYANVTYAFDTHTLTHTVPSLAFTNTHTHTSQVAYCPLDRKLYAWDGGHQMMYDVIFAY